MDFTTNIENLEKSIAAYEQERRQSMDVSERKMILELILESRRCLNFYLAVVAGLCYLPPVLSFSRFNSSLLIYRRIATSCEKSKNRHRLAEES